jgi:hypothetical protein
VLESLLSSFAYRVWMRPPMFSVASPFSLLKLTPLPGCKRVSCAAAGTVNTVTKGKAKVRHKDEMLKCFKCFPSVAVLFRLPGFSRFPAFAQILERHQRGIKDETSVSEMFQWRFIDTSWEQNRNFREILRK